MTTLTTASPPTSARRRSAPPCEPPKAYGVLFKATVAKRAAMMADLPASAFVALAATLGVSLETFAQSIGLNARTLRNRRENLSPDEAERSFRVYRVWRRATDVLDSKTQATVWMTSPKRALGDKTPLEMLRFDFDEAEVMNLLGAIEEGGYL
jgi:putative toxin-antitoxin system antitoxin component (TIGR02293 family)